MKALRVSVALLFVVLAQSIPTLAEAQVGEPTIEQISRDGLMVPNGSATYFIEVTNNSDTPIVVSGAQMIDVLDTSEIEPERCPRVWFGDAGYPDRPRGEDEQNPPSPPYPLPGVTLATAVELQPGEIFAFPGIDLYMIQAAPNACQARQMTIVYEADWQFQAPVQTYGTVAGVVTDTAAAPVDNAVVTITGTTDEGVATEELAVDSAGNYASTTNYLTGTELTVTASADGYTTASAGTTVVEGVNTVNIAMEPIPVATGTVSGTVLDTATGDFIPNATVVLSGIGADGNQVSETVTSDAAGNFVGNIQFQAGSTVTITTSAPGYEPTESSLPSVGEGANTISPEMSAVQEENPAQTPTPEPEQTTTPPPTSTVEPEVPATEAPTATTPVTDPGPTAPSQQSQEEESDPVVSTLPSTGSGSNTSYGLLLSGVLATALLTAVGIRKRHH